MFRQQDIKKPVTREERKKKKITKKYNTDVCGESEKSEQMQKTT